MNDGYIYNIWFSAATHTETLQTHIHLCLFSFYAGYTTVFCNDALHYFANIFVYSI